MRPIPRVRPRPQRLKRCAGACHEGDDDRWQPLWCFDLDRRRADGRRSVCRSCRAARRAELADAGAPRLRPWETQSSVRRAALAAGLSPTTVYYRLERGLGLGEALAIRLRRRG